MAGSVSGPSAPRAFVVRADALSPRASLRFLSASRLIAGISRLTTTRSQTVAPRPVGCASGGEMLFKAAIALLAIWLLGCMVGVYRVGDLAHVFLLVGLMLLLLAMLKARDAALRPPSPPTED